MAKANDTSSKPTPPNPPEGQGAANQDKKAKIRTYKAKWNLLRNGESYAPGDSIELTEKEAAAIGDVLEPT